MAHIKSKRLNDINEIKNRVEMQLKCNSIAPSQVNYLKSTITNESTISRNKYILRTNANRFHSKFKGIFSQKYSKH